jgi:mannose-1-phosphate guanylyltransferase
MSSGPIENFWAVIPAGGAGTRLWPLSRSTSPKFLRDLTGSGRTLLQATVDRLEELVADRFLVVTGAAHRAEVAAQLPGLSSGGVLAEPSGRDSMAAIGLAAAVLEERDPDAVLGSFHADHVVTEPAAFRDAVRTAVAAARDGWLVTLGIEPTHPSTAFGYIHLGDPLEGHDGVHVASGFVEKPSAEVAEGYVAGGVHRWNAGMFVVRPTVLLDLLAERHPEFTASLRQIASDPDRLEEVWPTLPRIAIDHAVAEPAAAAQRVAVVPAAIGWDDIGGYDSLATLSGPGSHSGRVCVLGDPDRVHGIDSSGLVVPHGERTVVVLGLEDVVVVETEDAILVTSLARAQDVKRVVTALKESGREDLT